jgi:hypothetical protein
VFSRPSSSSSSSSTRLYGRESRVRLFFIPFSSANLALAVLPFRILGQRTPLKVMLIVILVALTNFATMFSYPMYFLAVEGKTAAEAGAHLVPTAASNVLGGFVAGYVVHQTGKYRLASAMAGLIAGSSFSSFPFFPRLASLASLRFFPSNSRTELLPRPSCSYRNHSHRHPHSLLIGNPQMDPAIPLGFRAESHPQYLHRCAHGECRSLADAGRDRCDVAFQVDSSSLSFPFS